MKIRSFLAFDVTNEIRHELGSMIQLFEQKVQGVKWVKPGLLHCTVKFFGNIEEGFLMGDLSHVIEETVRHQAPIQLRSVGVGVFPNWRYPRIIWAGLAGETEAAVALHERLEKAFAAFGIHEEKRDAFRLHLTIGRAKAPIKGCESFVNLVEKLADKEFGEFTIDHLTLYKSVLTREGPVYTALREFRLGGQ